MRVTVTLPLVRREYTGPVYEDHAGTEVERTYAVTAWADVTPVNGGYVLSNVEAFDELGEYFDLEPREYEMVVDALVEVVP